MIPPIRKTMNIIHFHRQHVYIQEIPPYVMQTGRNRREIEKEGFNSQKNGGCNALLAFSKTLRTQRAHYLPFQIGRAICQPLPGARSLLQSLNCPKKRCFIAFFPSLAHALKTENCACANIGFTKRFLNSQEGIGYAKK
jgi:hypothetical protein